MLSQALNELELNVEHCSEIFTALQRVTARSFDLVVVDWDEGLDGGFLLQTARELKTNTSAFALVVTRGDARSVARQTGAHLVLTKPILPDQVQFALLGSDEFLRRMKTWLPARNTPGTTVHVGEKGVRSEPVSLRRAPQAIPAQFTAAAPVPAAQTHVAAKSAPAHLTFATLDGEPFHKSVFNELGRWKRPGRGTRTQLRRRDTAFLRRAAMVVVFFSVGYVLSQPMSQVAANFAQIYRGTPDSRANLPNVDKDVQAAQALVPTDLMPSEDAGQQPRSRSSSGAKIRVVSVSDPWEPRSSQHRRRSQEQTQPQMRVTEGASLESVDAAAGTRIPASLKSPSPEDATAHSVAAKLGSPLLSALEPVLLPEYLSEKLLTDKVQPNYPEQAIRAGLQGAVVLQAWIGRDGKIIDLKMIRGPLLLGQAACKAVKQWRYKPYLLNGEAVEAQTYVTVDFRLP